MTTKAAKPKGGGNKKKPQQKLKNVLAYPFPQYWPELNAEQTEELKNTILTNSNDVNPPPIIGLTKLLRIINRDLETSILLSTDIKPRFVASQIINLTISKFKKCQVLCVPNLKELTKTLFGIETIAVGYQKDQCQPVANWIGRTQEKYFPIPDKIQTYYAQTLNCKKDVNLKVKSGSVKKKNQMNIGHLHLKRNSANYDRAFIPRSIDGSKPISFDSTVKKDPVVWSDFISLSSKAERMDVDNEDSDDIEMDKLKLANTLDKLMTKENNGNLTDVKIKSENLNGKRHLDDDDHKNQKKNGKNGHAVNYIGLSVNRIQPNPDKIKKKKKKKGNK